MIERPRSDLSRLVAELESQGLLSSAQLQQRLGKSQATVSRWLHAAGPSGVVAFGHGKRTRYGVIQPILGLVHGQQALWLLDEQGSTGGPQPWGTLSLLGDRHVHVASPTGEEWVTRDALPWFLATLRLEGFLGRMWARSRALSLVLGDAVGDPSLWGVERQLYAAVTRVHDLPGAFLLGDSQTTGSHPAPFDDEARATHYDVLAADVSMSMLPAGSSAGGEQAKFLQDRPLGPDDAGLRESDWESLVVKFSPPRSTPFGQRWHDLLNAEATALGVLREAGEPVSTARVLQSSTRTYLESVRFDRIGRHGHRHAVPLSAVHQEFVRGPATHWSATCAVLVQQGRLSPDAARSVQLWRAYGQLIGNNDMHFGNLSLLVDDIAKGHFSLAPCYDMLPMRYRPDGTVDDFGLVPLQFDDPLTADLALRQQAVRLALTFWERVSACKECSAAFRAVAAVNLQNVHRQVR